MRGPFFVKGVLKRVCFCNAFLKVCCVLVIMIDIMSITIIIRIIIISTSSNSMNIIVIAIITSIHINIYIYVWSDLLDEGSFFSRGYLNEGGGILFVLFCVLFCVTFCFCFFFVCILIVWCVLLRFAYYLFEETFCYIEGVLFYYYSISISLFLLFHLYYSSTMLISFYYF